MLRPLSSLSVREQKATEYIKQAIKNHQHELTFTHQQNSNPHFSIINLRVIDFLNRKKLIKRHVVCLNLSKCKLNDEALALLSRGNWLGLQNLNLFGNDLTSHSFAPLSHGSWKRLLQIDLSSNKFGSNEGQQLSGCNWQQLTHLDLSDNATRLVFIAKMTGNSWKRLVSVNVSNNLLCNSSLVHLVTFQWPKLESLDLQHNLITDDGMRILVRGNWRIFIYLKLSFNPIGVEGLHHLSNNGWKNQMKLYMICNQDIHNNLVSYSLIVNQNLAKSKVLLIFPQKKIKAFFSKTSTQSHMSQQLCSVLLYKNIEVVM